jgi:two-component system, sensor histidine kinase PdtaS
MVRKLTIVMVLVMLIVTSYGQGVSGEEADSLLKSLPRAKADEERMDIYLKVAQYYIFKAGERQEDFDKSREYMRKAAQLNTKIKSKDAEAFQLLLESQISKETGRVKEGKAMAETAVDQLSNGQNKFYLGTAYFCLSEYHSYANANQSGEKRRLVELAVLSFEQTKNTEQLAYCLKLLADLYALNDERQKALVKLHRVLHLYDSIGYTALQGVFVLYSHIYYTDGDYKQSLTYGLKALKNAQTGGDSSMSLCQINNYIGITLVRLGDFEKAIGYYQAALKVAQRYNDNDAVLQVMANIVESYIELKKPGEALAFMKSIPKNFLKPGLDESYFYAPFSYLLIYDQQKDYASVQSYINQVLGLIKIHKPSDKSLHKFYSFLTGFYLQTKQYASANQHARKIDSLSRKIGDPHRIKEDYYLKFRLDTAQGLYKSATENLLKYQTLHDSLFNETVSRQIKQLEVEYETEKNRNEITVLNQKNLLQKNRLDREQLVSNFTIAGIALLVIIMALLYRQYRLKQQSNKVILQKNEQLQHFLTEKEWLVKEIHHRVKNNFHIVASLLEIQSSYLKNKEALSAIKESQHRIHSMSIIHQKLYQSETLSTIHMPDYIYELVEYLKESYAIRDNIAFSLEVETIELDHASAITLGLILNEAITNAIKYAFAKTGNGKIAISLSFISNSQLLLTISDNGRGLPDNFDAKIGASMGMELLQGLTDDLGGSFSIEDHEGTHIRVIFDYKPVTGSNVSFS